MKSPAKVHKVSILTNHFQHDTISLGIQCFDYDWIAAKIQPRRFDSVMSKSLGLPTTVDAFVQFLNGKPVEGYGDAGTIVLDALKHTIQLTIQDALGRRVRGTPIDVYRFLRHKVVYMLSAPLHAILTSALGPIDDARFDVLYDACLQWAQSFGKICLFQSKDQPSLVPTSQVPSLIQNLVQDIDKQPIPASENDDRIVRISEELLSCMLQYLDDLKNEEELARSTEHSLTLTVRGMNMQEALDGDLLDPEDWQRAWNQPYSGHALDALETKLQLNADAIRTDYKKAEMSRIIPVVQASGTGKSRLSEEYGSFLILLMASRFVRKNFGVMFSLKNGSSFPDRVCLSVLSSDTRTIMCQNTSEML